MITTKPEYHKPTTEEIERRKKRYNEFTSTLEEIEKQVDNDINLICNANIDFLNSNDYENDKDRNFYFETFVFDSFILTKLINYDMTNDDVRVGLIQAIRNYNINYKYQDCLIDLINYYYNSLFNRYDLKLIEEMKDNIKYKWELFNICFAKLQNELDKLCLFDNSDNTEYDNYLNQELENIIKAYQEDKNNDSLAEVESQSKHELIPILDYEDIIEVYIKTHYKAGDIFPNLKTLYNDIGITNLNGSKEKQKAKDFINQYITVENIPNTRKIKIVEIFEEPKYLIITDGRGKQGKFVNLTPQILLNHLYNEKITDEYHSLYFTVADIANILGVGYNKRKAEEIAKNTKMSNFRYNKVIYYGVIKKQRAIIYTLLHILQNERNVLRYYDVYRIKTNKGEWFYIDKELAEYISKIEGDIMTEMNIDNKSQLFSNRGLLKVFNKKVIENINSKYGYEWESYYQAIQIVITNPKRLELTRETYKLQFDELQEKKQLLLNNFISSVKGNITSDYKSGIKNGFLQNTMPKDEKIKWLFETNSISSEIIELYNNKVIDEEQILKVIKLPAENEIALTSMLNFIDALYLSN